MLDHILKTAQTFQNTHGEVESFLSHDPCSL